MGSQGAGIVPFFVISTNGSRLSSQYEGLVKEIIITERVDAPSSFAIKLSDPQHTLGSRDEFSIGSKIKIKVGSSAELEELVTAEVTSLQSECKMQGSDYLIVKGLDAMHKLFRGRKTRSFNNKTESDIVQEIINDNSLSPDVGSFGSKKEFVFQKDMTDFDYIMSIAKRYNCKVWCEDRKIIVKEVQVNSADVVVEYMKSLLSFSGRIDSNRLFNEVEVRGWNPNNFSPVSSTKTANDISQKVGGNTIGLKDIEDNFGSCKMTLVDENIKDMNTADTIGVNILTDMSFNYITCTATCQGNNKIRAGAVVEVKEVGEPFAGKYFVQSVTHKVNSYQGYITSFDGKRNALA